MLRIDIAQHSLQGVQVGVDIAENCQAHVLPPLATRSARGSAVPKHQFVERQDKRNGLLPL